MSTIYLATFSKTLLWLTHGLLAFCKGSERLWGAGAKPIKYLGQKQQHIRKISYTVTFFFSFVYVMFIHKIRSYVMLEHKSYMTQYKAWYLCLQNIASMHVTLMARMYKKILFYLPCHLNKCDPIFGWMTDNLLYTISSVC